MATDSDRFGPLHDPAVRSQRLGTHEIFIEGDIVFQRSHGTTTLSDTQEMFALCNEVYERYGYVLVLIDSSQGGMATPEAQVSVECAAPATVSEPLCDLWQHAPGSGRGDPDDARHGASYWLEAVRRSGGG